MYNLLDCKELVEVKENDKIIIEMMYPKLGMKNAIDKCYLRKVVYDKLLEATHYLPKEYSFKILDAYRPFELQKELYTTYYQKIVDEFDLHTYSKEEKDRVINNFVALPNKNEAPAHTTGSAIDLTLVKDSNDIDMGCSFDEFSGRSYTNYYIEKDKSIHNNRMILYNCMIKAGFTNIETEFWHYDYGNKNWAEKTGNEIIFNEICDKKSY